jgi:peptidyl-prolyl cis-trans isomerase SurA
MTLRVLTILAVAFAANSCAPSINLLPPQTPQEKRMAELETSIAQAKDEQAPPKQNAGGMVPATPATPSAPPPAEPPRPADPALDAMKRARYEPDPKVVGSVVAVVNGDIVTREEVLRDARRQLDAIDADPTLTEIGRDARRRELIGAVILLKVERLLALQEARRVIPPEEAERIEADAQAVIADVIRALGTMTRMEVMLRQEGHTVGSQKQVEIDNRRIRALLSREVDARVDVTPGEVQRYYAEHTGEFARKAQARVREIFVSAEKAGSPEKAAEKAKLLRERVLAGEEFARVAEGCSDGPNAAQGGLWEWATAGGGTFRPEVERAAFALGKGETSEVVVSEIGAHVLRAEDARPARTLSCAEAQGDILAKLRNKKRDELYRALIKRLWDKSYVDIRWK